MFWFYPAMFSLIWPNLKEQFVKYWCIDLCIWRVTGNNTLSFKQSMRPSFKWAYIYIQQSRALTWIKDIKSGILLLFFVTFFQIFVTLTIFISETLWSDEKYCMPHGKLKNNCQIQTSKGNFTSTLVQLLLAAALSRFWKSSCLEWEINGLYSLPVFMKWHCISVESKQVIPSFERIFDRFVKILEKVKVLWMIYVNFNQVEVFL